MMNHEELTVKVFALRYAVTRHTYAPSLVCDNLKKYLPQIDSIHLEQLKKELNSLEPCDSIAAESLNQLKAAVDYELTLNKAKAWSREWPKAGEVWRHFKNNDYLIVACPVKHTEIGGMLVCYKALYGAREMYVRPFEMFMSEVDHRKYPNAKQKWRFEKVSDSDVANESAD